MVGIRRGPTLRQRLRVRRQPGNNDTEDFPEVSILAIQAMLEKAYLLGKADAQKTSH